MDPYAAYELGFLVALFFGTIIHIGRSIQMERDWKRTCHAWKDTCDIYRKTLGDIEGFVEDGLKKEEGET
jgi:hypothetical protein